MADIWRGRLVRLRAVEPTDWEKHYLWNQDGDMSRRLDHIWMPTSSAFVKRWAEQTSLEMAKDDAFEFEVEAVNGAALVGHIGVHQCDHRVGSFFVGVATLAEHRRKGYASEALLLVARYYFQELRYQKMNAQVYAFNEPSLKLFEKVGFIREGVLRRMAFTGGRHYDVVAYGLTDEEFTARHPETANAWRGGGG